MAIGEVGLDFHYDHSPREEQKEVFRRFVALARELKSVGFRFIGPTTAYAAMQACGLVDDHLASCPSAR